MTRRIEPVSGVTAISAAQSELSRLAAAATDPLAADARAALRLTALVLDRLNHRPQPAQQRLAA